MRTRAIYDPGRHRPAFPLLISILVALLPACSASPDSSSEPLTRQTTDASTTTSSSSLPSIQLTLPELAQLNIDRSAVPAGFVVIEELPPFTRDEICRPLGYTEPPDTLVVEETFGTPTSGPTLHHSVVMFRKTADALDAFSAYRDLLDECDVVEDIAPDGTRLTFAMTERHSPVDLASYAFGGLITLSDDDHTWVIELQIAVVRHENLVTWLIGSHQSDPPPAGPGIKYLELQQFDEAAQQASERLLDTGTAA